MKRQAIALLALSSALVALPALARAPAATPAPMSIEDLLTLKRIAAPVVSPDGKWVVYQQTDTDPQGYKRTAGLWRVAASGGTPERIADMADAAESDPAFSADGSRLYFLSARSGSNQVWLLDLATPGAAPVQASAFKADVAGFKLSPDGGKVLVWGDVARGCPTLGCDDDGDTSRPGPGTGRHYKDGAGFVRHWDAWETHGNYSRAFAFALQADGKLGHGGTALDGPAGTLTGDTPGKPHGGGDELAWSMDSKAAWFIARQADRDEPLSTNTDLWHAPEGGGAPHNFTADNKASDALPTPSPDGKWIAWAAMARPGYESDRQVVHIANLSTGEKRALTAGWDRSVASLAWTRDSKYLIATAQDVMDTPAFRIDPATAKVERLKLMPKGMHEGHIANVVPLNNGGLLFTRDAIAHPTEVWITDSIGSPARPLTRANEGRLAAMAPVATRRFSFAGANGDTVWGQIHKPAAAEGKLPVLLFIHGGPQGSYNDSWSWRWNPRLFASQGYGVVSIDFHGSTGYGQAFTDAINKDWGGKPLVDLQKGLEAALKLDGALDGEKACALGASYGGYMANWIAGQWPDRFACLVQHDGVFDARAMAYETEELWFDEWEHGGKPYHEAPGEYEKWNPVNHVSKWNTPMLVITSEKDFRIPYTQGLASFAALQRRGVPSELLIFPDENHWVLKPKNSKQWHQSVLAWLDRWLRK